MVRVVCSLLLLCPLGVQAAEWTVKVDPPAAKPYVWPADWKLDLPLPKMGGFGAPVLAFTQPASPFVVVGYPDFKQSVSTIYDLQTAKKLGEITVPKRMFRQALSADGKILAGFPEEFPKQTLQTFDVATGKTLATLPVEFGGEFVFFVGNEQVAYRARGGTKRDILIADAKSGKEVGKIPAEAFLLVPPIVSPGGAYMVIPKQESIVFWNLREGKQVAELTTKVRKPTDVPGASPAYFQVRGIAFSPDGGLLAAMSEGLDARILVWSMKDGQVVQDIMTDKMTFVAFDGSKIEWLPDESGWLLNGTHVVDRTTGKTIWSMPQDFGTMAHRRAADAGTLITMDAKDRNAPKLHLATQPKDKIAAIRAALKSGGSAVDAVLPKLATPNVAQAKEIDVPLPGLAWKATIDAVPETPMVARRPVPLTRKVTEYEGLFLTHGAKPMAVFDLAKKDNAFGPASESSPRQLEVVDLTTGKITTTFDLPAGCQMVGISDDGRFALTRDMALQQRLDLWSIEKKAHIVGWKPYGTETVENNRKITFVGFAGSTLLTQNAVGLCIAWNTSNATATYTLNLRGSQSPLISPSGKHLVVVQHGVVRFIEVATGTFVGDLEPKAQGDFTVQGPVAIRSDGKEVSALVRVGHLAPTMLVRWDHTGKRIEEVPYPGFVFGTPTLSYADDQHLLFDKRDLYDIQRKAILWRYMLGGMGKIAQRTPDQRVWYVTGNPLNAETALTALALPEEAVSNYVKEIADGKSAILQAGTKVNVAVAMLGTYAEKVKETTLTAVKTTLKLHDLVYDEKADLVLSISIGERKTGDTIAFRKLFGGIRDTDPFAKLTVPEIEILVSTELRAGTELLWSSPQKLTMGDFYGIIRLPDDGTNLTDYLYKQIWDKVPGRAAAMSLPRFLAKTPDGLMTLPGNTILQVGGPNTMKPTVKK